jgi:hypothetical protein
VSVAREAHLFLDCRPKVLDQMKTIGYLPGLRCTLPGGPGIEAAAISADDLNSRTFLQPCLCALDATIVQNIDDCSAFEIDHDGAVVQGLPPAPIINANNSNIIILP